MIQSTQMLIEKLELELQGEDEIDQSIDRQTLNKRGKGNNRIGRNKSAPKEINTIIDDSSEESVSI